MLDSINIFRPTRGGEETVDVAIITQLIAPLLQQREEDGTYIFDSFGEAYERKARRPDELIMFCVDCSRSMGQPSDFDELKEEDDEDEDTLCDMTDDEDFSESSDEQSKPESSTSSGIPLSEVKGWSDAIPSRKRSYTDTVHKLEHVSNHESYQDMLAIIRTGSLFERDTVASAVLKHLSILYRRQISHLQKKIEDMKSWATGRFFADQSKMHHRQMAQQTRLVAGLAAHKRALCDFLQYHAANSLPEDKPWQWHVGEEAPKWRKKGAPASQGLAEPLLVPKVRGCCWF